MQDDFLGDPWKYDLPAMSAPTCSDETICIPDDKVQRGRQMLRGKKPVGGKGSHMPPSNKKKKQKRVLDPSCTGKLAPVASNIDENSLRSKDG